MRIGTKMRDTSLNLTEVLWLGPETEHVYLGSPSITKDPVAGRLLVSHDFFGKSTMDYTEQIFGSDDRGASWRLRSNVTGIYWASLFSHAGASYLIGSSSDDHTVSAAVITTSTDAGESWLVPVVLFPGNRSWPLQQYHCAPTPVLFASNGRVYRAFETEEKSAYGHYTALVLSASADADLLQPSAWRQSSILPFQREFVPPSWGSSHFSWQEGNAVEAPNGDIWNILRIDGQTNATHNKAAVTVLDTQSGALTFKQMIDFPATSSKFSIRRDAASKLYYTLSTNVTAANLAIGCVGARNNLVFATSSDLIEWRVCAQLLYDDTGFTPQDSCRYTGFHYVDWIFDGADILYVPRTGYRGADSFHNANRVTYKVIEGYAAACEASVKTDDQVAVAFHRLASLKSDDESRELPPRAAERPHIVFTLIDDLGFDDTDIHGSSQIPTPNIRALAQGGVVLMQYYVMPVCTPTRSAIMTGRHPIHTGMACGALLGQQRLALPLRFKLLPEMLQLAGYQTFMSGKWHLGFFSIEHMPSRRGFEKFYGFLTGKLDYFRHSDDEYNCPGHELFNKAGAPLSPFTCAHSGTFPNITDFAGLDLYDNETLDRGQAGRYNTELWTTKAIEMLSGRGQ
jgi:hypothetical protein